jgi:hypothetical protein
MNSSRELTEPAGAPARTASASRPSTVSRGRFFVAEVAPATPRHLFIVARDHASLFRYLREQFASEEGVEVLLDRRRAVSRVAGALAGLEPGGGDRRQRCSVDSELRLKGYVFLTVGLHPADGERGSSVDTRSPTH